MPRCTHAGVVGHVSPSVEGWIIRACVHAYAGPHTRTWQDTPTATPHCSHSALRRPPREQFPCTGHLTRTSITLICTAVLSSAVRFKLICTHSRLHTCPPPRQHAHAGRRPSRNCAHCCGTRRWHRARDHGVDTAGARGRQGAFVRACVRVCVCVCVSACVCVRARVCVSGWPDGLCASV
jgi:hypothetical protein